MRSNEFINESINDKGIFKAVMFGGIPAAGKSYVLNKVTNGGIGARIVNTDKMVEFLANREMLDLRKKEHQYQVLDRAKILNIAQFANYVNGMLPLFIDGTSADASNTLRRVGILEGFGYDVGFVWVDTDLDVAIARAKQRQRNVDEAFIRAAHSRSLENRDYFAHKFDHFVTVKNNDGELTDNAIQSAFAATTGFFSSPLNNPIGRRTIRTLQEHGNAYMSPEMFTLPDIQRILQNWYRKV